MTVSQNNGSGPLPQSRQANGSYKLPIEARAALAVVMAESGWLSLKDAAASLCVNRTYLMLARRLDDDDRLRLAHGELKLARVFRDYQQRLAEQRAQREQAERAAQEQAEREAVEAARERVKRFANGGVSTLSDDAVERIVVEVGVDRIWRVVDKITQPQLPLMTAAE
jgi:hypothetical protein